MDRYKNLIYDVMNSDAIVSLPNRFSYSVKRTIVLTVITELGRRGLIVDVEESDEEAEPIGTAEGLVDKED